MVNKKLTYSGNFRSFYLSLENHESLCDWSRVMESMVRWQFHEDLDKRFGKKE